MTTPHPPTIWYEPAPDLARPRHTAAVCDLLDAATHRLDLRYPLQPHQPEELAVRDVAAAVDELRAIVESLCERVAAIADDPAPAYADEDTAFMASIVGEVIARVLAEGYDPDAAPSDAVQQREYDREDAGREWSTTPG